MKIFRIISCYALSLLVLFSSSYVVVGIHVCRDRVQEISLFSKTNGCAMEQQTPPCHRELAKACCENKVIIHDGQSYNAPAAKLSLADAPFVQLAQPSVFVSVIVPSTGFFTPQHFNYDPPLPEADRTVSYRVFII